jgi:YD repeat-containing protein
MSRRSWHTRLRWTAALLTIGGIVIPTQADSSADFTYDAVGRVTTALYDNASCVAYGYDANGNRTSQTNTISSSPEIATWGTGVLGCFKWTPQ